MLFSYEPKSLGGPQTQCRPVYTTLDRTWEIKNRTRDIMGLSTGFWTFPEKKCLRLYKRSSWQFIVKRAWPRTHCSNAYKHNEIIHYYSQAVWVVWVSPTKGPKPIKLNWQCYKYELQNKNLERFYVSHVTSCCTCPVTRVNGVSDYEGIIKAPCKALYFCPISCREGMRSNSEERSIDMHFTFSVYKPTPGYISMPLVINLYGKADDMNVNMS